MANIYEDIVDVLVFICPCRQERLPEDGCTLQTCKANNEIQIFHSFILKWGQSSNLTPPKDPQLIMGTLWANIGVCIGSCRDLTDDGIVIKIIHSLPPTQRHL